MFWFRETHGRVEVAFTDRHDGFSDGPFDSLNLGSSSGDDRSVVVRNHAAVAQALGVEGLHSMSQVHGVEVVHADVLRADGSGTVAECDALVTDRRDLALLVRVADCVPVLLADEDAGLVAAAHAGRVGLVEGVVPATVEALRERGATALQAWVGPRACGRCYELPAELADAVDAAVPGTRSTTSWGTPATDVGAGVVGQLRDAGVEVHDVGAKACTIEDDTFYSYRRQGTASGRFGGVVVLR
ncbi:MAG: peptidoglycan editing factor PgeF [Aeromicrobium erythreum]